ncbi:hypothetical protein BDN71DRAFT_1500365 [Pleurotus eryngii]|uniref:Uncharacterized protein n=1 Tax=Pleurotus eryngii TaxID=5323 RepID=A0A9P6DCZ4_PLEER|nr:hypothetical protein BDN71DRAFT_1500365 [Pleurotus eryngii]
MQRGPTPSKLNTGIVNKLREANILPQDEPPPKLCSGCSGITVAKMRVAGGYKHPINVYDLPKSAEDCNFCKHDRDGRYALALEQYGFKQKKKGTSFVALVQWPLPEMEHVVVIEKFMGVAGAPGEGLVSICGIYRLSIRSRSPVGIELLLVLKVPAEVDLDMLANPG